MNWVDLTILGVIFISAIIGWLRGFMREVLSVGAWIAAAWVAASYREQAAAMLAPYLPSADLALPVGASLAFIIALILFSVAAAVLSRIAQTSALSPLDSTLGIVFGLVRGAVVVLVAYIGGGMLLPSDRWPPAVQDAKTLPYIQSSAVKVMAMVPADYRPVVAPLPGTPGANTASGLPAMPRIGPESSTVGKALEGMMPPSSPPPTRP